MLGALSITILMHFQRIILVLQNPKEFEISFGFAAAAMMLRMLIFFGYSYLLLSFNTIWKFKWHPPRIGRKTFYIAVNSALFLFGVIITTMVMARLLAGTMDKRSVLAILTTDFLIVHPILLLLARFTNLSFQQQQIILEKEQAKQSALQHQLEALRSQINPHFLFNA